MNKVTCPLLKENMVKGPEKKRYGRTATSRAFELRGIVMTFMPSWKGKLKAAGEEEHAGRAIKKRYNKEWNTEYQMEHV